MRWTNSMCWRRRRSKDPSRSGFHSTSFDSPAWYTLMRMRFPRAAAVLAVYACAALMAPEVRAQDKGSHHAAPPRRPPAQQWKAPKNPKNPRLPQPNPAVELRRFLDMKPEQREKELSKLPPQRREHMEQQLGRFESLPPDKREKQLQRLEMMQDLRPDRRQAVNQEIQRLRALPFAERREFLYSDMFQRNFAPDERALIHGAFPGIPPRE